MRLRARAHQARCFWLLNSVLNDAWRYDRDSRRGVWLLELKRLALRLNWMYRLGITMTRLRAAPRDTASRLFALQRGGINTVSAVTAGVLRLVDSETPIDPRELDLDIMRWDTEDDPPIVTPFLMGAHPRLGQFSFVRALDDECLQLITAFSLG